MDTYSLFCLDGIELVFAFSSTIDVTKGSRVGDVSRYEWYSMD